MTELDFYFDFGSPTAYLAYQRLQQLQQQYQLQINYKPMLLGGVFKATQNQSPVTIPAKGAYMMKHDLPRFARRYGVPFNMNPYFPINTLTLMRGAYAALQQQCLPTYCRTIFDAVWVQALNVGDINILKTTLDNAGLNGEQLLVATQQDDIKQQLINATEAAIARGIFGAPTFFVGDEMFFGQDRLDFLEEILKRSK